MHAHSSAEVAPLPSVVENMSTSVQEVHVATPLPSELMKLPSKHLQSSALMEPSSLFVEPAAHSVHTDAPSSGM